MSLTTTEITDIIKALSQVIAAVFTGIVAIYGIRLGNRLVRDRERQNKALEAEWKRKHWWEEFETQTVLEFQDHASKHSEILDKFRLTVLTFPDATGTERRYESYKVIHEFTASHVRLYDLASRIRDDETRKLAHEFMKKANEFRDSAGWFARRISNGVEVNQDELGPMIQDVIESYGIISRRISVFVRERMNETLGN